MVGMVNITLEYIYCCHGNQSIFMVAIVTIEQSIPIVAVESQTSSRLPRQPNYLYGCHDNHGDAQLPLLRSCLDETIQSRRFNCLNGYHGSHGDTQLSLLLLHLSAPPIPFFGNLNAPVQVFL